MQNILLAIFQSTSVLHHDVIARLGNGRAIALLDDVLGDTHSESCGGEDARRFLDGGDEVSTESEHQVCGVRLEAPEVRTLDTVFVRSEGTDV